MGEVDREHVVILSPGGTVVGRLFVETGEVYIFCPPEAAQGVEFINEADDREIPPLPALPLEHGEVAELDGVVCFKFQLGDQETLDEAMLYQGRVAAIAKLTGQ